jgi:hypothetical protein
MTLEIRSAGIRIHEFVRLQPQTPSKRFFVRYDVMKLAINNPPRPPPATTCQADLRSIGIA